MSRGDISTEDIFTIKLEKTKAIEGAVKRAVKNHNFVTMTGKSQYLVITGKSEAGYTDKFLKGADGFAWATCNCPAGREAMGCHHIISAGLLTLLLQQAFA